MKIAVVMMVRDEADILWKCLAHWRLIGVRDFYICDNGSVDQTPKLLKAFKADSSVNVTLFTDDRTDWPGREVINRMKDTAINDGCNFIFPADADEFLQIPGYSDVCNMAESIGADSGWGELPYLNILPDKSSSWQRPHKKAFGFIKKDQTISMGNHVIEGVEPIIKDHFCYYKHYSLRSFEQFKQKMENYMTAFSKTTFQDHPHAVDFKQWKIEGESFLRRRWAALTNTIFENQDSENAPKWL